MNADFQICKISCGSTPQLSPVLCAQACAPPTVAYFDVDTHCYEGTVVVAQTEATKGWARNWSIAEIIGCALNDLPQHLRVAFLSCTAHLHMNFIERTPL